VSDATGAKPAPATSGTNGANAGAQPVVRSSGVGASKPFGIGLVKSVNRR
jgi:hypothetical protein